MKKLIPFIATMLLVSVTQSCAADKQWVVYEGKDGPGKGKHIVFLAGDEEYRSEEALPMLARILAVRHGFKCTVIFSINPKDGTIDPCTLNNQPGIELLHTADACVMSLRFRDWPDDQMKHFVDYYLSGKPFVALRTSTHAFNIKRPDSPYAKYSWRSKEPWDGGFGRQVLGETWVAHHGWHGHEATLGVIEPSARNHPILRGVGQVFGLTDVYTASPSAECNILMRGQVLSGMKPTDPPVVGKQKPTDKHEKNNPMQPIVWTREHKNEAGKVNKICCTTMGAAVDLESEGLRRVLVNACYWVLGLEDKIADKNNVDCVGEYKPLYFGYGKFKPGVKPADLELK
jgi:hypothetical protein